jgi:endogenous inhibitor of DNA gyrase (YacG/DUF329 family)
MALVKCPECGKDVSTTAKKCPHCGFVPPMNDVAWNCPEWPTPPPAGMSEAEWQRRLAVATAEETRREWDTIKTWLAIIVFIFLASFIAYISGCDTENQ